MRILYAVNTFRPQIDGVGVSIERQAIGLAERGHSVAIIAPSANLSSYVESHPCYRLYRLRAVAIDRSRRLLPLLSRQGVDDALRDFRPDVVVVSVPFLLSRVVAQVARRRGYPLVGITSMMPEWFYYNLRPIRSLVRLLHRSLWRHITSYYNQCDHVVGVTETALQLLIDHGLRRPSSIISNGVPLDVFYPRQRDRVLAARLGIPDRPAVLYVGRLDAEKCMDVWIRAIPRVLDRLPAHFIVGGDGRERQKLEELARDLGVAASVSFIGFRPDDEYPALFSLADVFAISSPVELQSIVTLEAAASGLPIVAARAGALPELVRDQVNGRLFTPSDPADLAEAILDVLLDPDRREQMSARARLSVAQHDFRFTLDRYEHLYQQLIYCDVTVARCAAEAVS